MSKNTIFTVLAILGGVVVLGWALKLTFKLLALLVLVAICYGIYRLIEGDKIVGGPR